LGSRINLQSRFLEQKGVQTDENANIALRDTLAKSRRQLQSSRD